MDLNADTKANIYAAGLMVLVFMLVCIAAIVVAFGVG